MTTHTTPATHTPGPWHLIPSQTSDSLTVGRSPAYDPNPIAWVPPVRIDIGLNWGEAKANARLIAAAPDLLAALSQLVFEVSHHLQSGDRGALVQNELRNAFAAISKASGVQS